jgi:hypothetical protein
MKRRKPVLIVDDGSDSLKAVDILRGVFKGLGGVEEYIASLSMSATLEAIPSESESAYW